MALSLVPQPIEAVAQEMGLSPEHVTPYGRGKAKVDLAALADDAPGQGKGRLVLVTAINPTPAGEGKTTTSVGLAMGLRRLGKKVALCLREPSLGPVFGVKGGGTGGGKAQLVPSDDINLHFTGDIHAITSAHNLLAAMIDNALHFRTSPLDARRVRWGRAMDMNDRSLRDVTVGLGGPTGGVPREDRFDITAASEVMAILSLAKDHGDLERRLARIVVGDTSDRAPVTAGDLGASGAMAALLRDALLPNLVQTAEGGPALVHAGPFGNIAHGCNSIVATRLGLKHGDYVVTEAGFGLDLGGEKFLDIKCREMGVFPRVAVVVATLRALKMHGGAPLAKVAEPDEESLLRGLDHLDKHLATLSETYGLPAVVAINVFPTDTAREIELVAEKSRERGARTVRCDGFAKAGEGALELAEVVAEVADATDASPPPARFAYELADTLEEKIRKVSEKVYGAAKVVLAGSAAKDIQRIRELGYGEIPVCMAKTQLSLSDDASKAGRPRDFAITVRAVRLSAGAGFAVPLTGEIMTMPGLPREPAAKRVRVLDNGKIVGLMQNE
jgi:formate--tetrahydrofolate ligase